MEATVINDRNNPRVAYRVATDHGEVKLIRTVLKPEILHAYNDRGDATRVDGFVRFTDQGGELRGVR